MFAKAKTLLKRGLAAIEPWYDWGKTDTFRLDCATLQESDANMFEARHVDLQWFGFHFRIEFGRMPAKVAA